MSAVRIDFEHKDLVRMYKTLDRVGASPQKALNKGTSKAATVIKRAVKARAPHDSGELRSAIITKTERTSIKGKKVRQTTIRGGADMNAIFQKPIKHPGVLGGKSDHAYYPNSQEFGFLARAKGGSTIFVRFLTSQKQTRKGVRDEHRMYYDDTGARVPSQKITGKHYMRYGAEASDHTAKTAMIETMKKELDKIWQSTNG